MILSIVAFVVAFSILVLVHEFGHFWVARKAGVAVEKFSIGFGPKIFGFKWKETDFCISLLPLGGFVKMRGEGEEEEISPTDTTAFSNKSVGARSAVVMAGPFMNLVLSFLLMPLVFWIGKPEITFLSEPPVVERIVPGSPAEKAGFQVGDKIIKFNGEVTATWEALLQPLALTTPGQTVSVEVERNQSHPVLKVEAAPIPGSEGSYLGIEKFFGAPPKAMVSGVVDGSPAAQAGLEKGDLILTVEGQPVENWDALIRAVTLKGGVNITLQILRDKAPLSLQIKPKWDESAKRWLMGIHGPEDLNISSLQTKKYGFIEAVKVGWKTNIKNIGLTFEVLGKLVTREISYKTLGGPVQIAVALGKASASGLADFLYFMAFLSLQLAILNILPIPMLDGGHLLFFAVEAIRGKALSLKARLISQQVGMVLLLTLIFFVTLNDLERLLGLSKWFQKFWH
ncbi:MAG: RIP metalloprotease RseP [Deltaproteobacteria bacterium]|nr:RIP metalloprotease RseP [Deltaproteobacteria bacterium]